MEDTGHVDPDGYEQVISAVKSDGRVIAFWLGNGPVQAGMNVNVWDVTDSIHALVRSGGQVDPAGLPTPASR